MVDVTEPESPEALSSLDELRDVWNRFRAGDCVPCPRDTAPLALAVDASAGLYRFVCTHCITASPWFESDPLGVIRIRGHAESGRERVP
jgi:hypothetical protein